MVAAVACVGVCAGPAVARTAESSATQQCSKVSASSVSSVVGYSVPAATGLTLTAKPTKENDDISGTTLDCDYGKFTSIASIKKSVNITFETISKSVNTAEVKVLAEKTASDTNGHLKIAAYPALGNEAFLMTFSISGITAESLVTANGTKLYGATLYGNVASSKLASLVKLAEKL
jgi:hypothetical protein